MLGSSRAQVLKRRRINAKRSGWIVGLLASPSIETKSFLLHRADRMVGLLASPSIETGIERRHDRRWRLGSSRAQVLKLPVPELVPARDNELGSSRAQVLKPLATCVINQVRALGSSRAQVLKPLWSLSALRSTPLGSSRAQVLKPVETLDNSPNE